MPASTLAFTVAHVVLPTLVFELGEGVVRRLLSRDKSLLWRLPALLGSSAARHRVEVPRGFDHWAERLGQRQVTVVRFPRPQEHGEAHAAVLVPVSPGWTWPWARREVRYFVLEHDFDFGQDEPATLVVEWTRQHGRIVWGPGPRARDKPALFERLQDILDGEVAPRSPQPMPLDPFSVKRLLEGVGELERASA